VPVSTNQNVAGACGSDQVAGGAEVVPLVIGNNPFRAGLRDGVRSGGAQRVCLHPQLAVLGLVNFVGSNQYRPFWRRGQAKGLQHRGYTKGVCAVSLAGVSMRIADQRLGSKVEYAVGVIDK